MRDKKSVKNPKPESYEILSGGSRKLVKGFVTTATKDICQ